MKQDKTTIALSFRLGEEHRDKLYALSANFDLSQTDMLRKLIDMAFPKVFPEGIKREVHRRREVKRYQPPQPS